MRQSNFSLSLLRSALLGVLAVAVSLPLLFALQRMFHLGNPPVSGLFVLSLGVIFAFVGAAAIGIGMARSVSPRNARTSLWAALLALAWGVGLVSVLVPIYGGMVVDELTQEGALMAFRARGELLESAQDTLSQIQNGKSGEAARNLGIEGWKKTRELLVSGAARIPALSLLIWAIVAPPFIAAFESRAARR